MAKAGDLNPLQKRSLLYSPKATREALVEAGERFFERGRMYDAYQFFVKASHDAGLVRIKESAVADGDPFILNLIAHRDPTSVTREDWQRTGEVAERAGKKRYAAWAFERSGNEAKVAELLGSESAALAEDLLPAGQVNTITSSSD